MPSHTVFRILERDAAPAKLFADLVGPREVSCLPRSLAFGDQALHLVSQPRLLGPHDVEVPFETVLDGVGVRGRMDAVFADADGGWTVVDWKTGTVPDEATLRAVSVQLAAYRLAWSALSGAPLQRVRAAFHYVRANRTLQPADLLDADGLRDLLRTIPVG